MSILKLPSRLSLQGGNTSLPAKITKAGSKQTYYTFLLLADNERKEDAFRAYAYFRWLDDLLDCPTGTKQEKLTILKRQQILLDTCYQREVVSDVCPEEQMLVDLIHQDSEPFSGMQIYLRNMMKVMAFDVERCGRPITLAEISEYTQLLSSAVTELLFHLFGHQPPAPGDAYRYDAVKGAHIVHMLRDLMEDIPAGYLNIPAWLVRDGRFNQEELRQLPFRTWVYRRVNLARRYFANGRRYISRVKHLRCRLAGFAYIARFEWVLGKIEQDGYCLRAEYPERKSLRAAAWIIWRILTSSLRIPGIITERTKQAPLTDLIEDR